MPYLSYCGLLCDECPLFIATRDGDMAAKERLAAEYSGADNVFTAEDMTCEGCFSDNNDTSKMCGGCEIRRCAKEKNPGNCGRCGEYPCGVITAHVAEGAKSLGRLDEAARAKQREAEIIGNGRRMLRPDWDAMRWDYTDQRLGKPAPERFAVPEGLRVELPQPRALSAQSLSLYECMHKRRSKRKYTGGAMSAAELSYLAYAAGGVREVRKTGEKSAAFRTYPSGGNTQALDLYVFADKVIGVPRGLYKYLPMENALVLLDSDEGFKERLGGAAHTFDAQAVFFWTALPYRTEYRYVEVSHKMIAMEAGHACQNLYLAAESLGMGCVAIAAFSQTAADALIGVDGENEFVIYIASAGH